MKEDDKDEDEDEAANVEERKAREWTASLAFRGV
jgi:hypothetical protein